MTPVKFEFLGPDGQPIANQVFEIKLPKSGFLDGSDGVVMPDTLNPVTDSDGTVTLSLAPSSTPYFLKVLSPDADVGEDCCQPGIYYKFYVPIASHVVRVQDIIIDPPPSTRAYDEAALLIIIESKVISLDAAARAQASAEAAAASEQRVADDAEAARLSAEAAALSELNSGNSEDASKLYELASKASQDAARASELAAAASADFAAGAVTDMQEQVNEATEQAGIATAAANSANNSKIAAGQSAAASAADVVATHADVVTTTADKAATAADVATVTGLKTEVTSLKNETKGYRDETAAMVGSLGAIIVDGGPIDLSGGAYPAAPTQSTMWKVTVGGTVAGVQGDTYGVGDTLMYAKAQAMFYKIDNTENVSSVAGKTGAVTLEKGDVDLDQVDNTADLDKPVSTAQQAQFALRTPTASALDQTAGRLTKVGDYGENGGPALPQANTVDADLLTVTASYLFAAGGVHLPEASVYLKHMASGTAGNAKQLAWGYATDKTYVRTQVAGVWSAWAPATEIIDNLSSIDANKALSAKQGNVLYNMIQANNATIVRYTYNLTAGQTAITGVDLTGKTLSYVPGGVMLVELAGQPLWISKDYTASNGSLITLIDAPLDPSEIAITVFGSFSVADHYTKAEDDAKFLAKADVDLWAYKPIGEPFPLFTHLTGVSEPPTDKSYRYIKLTADDAYNAGALGAATVSGTFPLNLASAVITLASSPLVGQSVDLMNTSRRVLRAGVSGELENDQVQGFLYGDGSNYLSRLTSIVYTAGGNATAHLGGASTLSRMSDGVNGTPRTGKETRAKSIGAVYYMRIK